MGMYTIYKRLHMASVNFSFISFHCGGICVLSHCVESGFQKEKFESHQSGILHKAYRSSLELCIEGKCSSLSICDRLSSSPIMTEWIQGYLF